MEGYERDLSGISGITAEVSTSLNYQAKIAAIREATGTEMGDVGYKMTSVVESNDEVAGMRGMRGYVIHEHVTPDGKYTRAENPVFWGRSDGYDQPTSEDQGRIYYNPSTENFDTGDFLYDVEFDDPESETLVSAHLAGYPTDNNPDGHSMGCPTFGYENNDPDSYNMLYTIKTEAFAGINVRMKNKNVDRRNPAEKAKRPITKDKTITTESDQAPQCPSAPASPNSWGYTSSAPLSAPTEGEE